MVDKPIELKQPEDTYEAAARRLAEATECLLEQTIQWRRLGRAYESKIRRLERDRDELRARVETLERQLRN